MTPGAPLVLAVEDNPTLREMYRMVLSNAGFDCRTCETLAAGRAALASLREPCDLLIVDSRLPDGSGADFVDEALARFPDVGAHTLVVTGAAPGDRLARLAERLGGEVLQKPFRIQPFVDLCLRLARRTP